MSFWIAAILLTTAMGGLLLRPLYKRQRSTGIQPADVYNAQLAELEREVATGLVSEDDATSARAEIARRLLRAQEDAETTEPISKLDPRSFTITLISLVVAIGFGGYIYLGSPGLPGQPFATRDLATESAERLGPAAQELERQLNEIEDPADRALFLADALASVGAFDEAIEAYLNVLSMRSEDAAALTRIGEIQLAQANGTVSADIASWFDRALASDPFKPRATYYRALFDYQQGRFSEADNRLTALIESAPDGAVWVGQVSGLRDEARNALQLPEGAQDVLALDEAERDARIYEMVAGLAARLEENPDDFEGWLRLGNAYAVLGQPGESAQALLQALSLAGDEPVLRERVIDVANQYGIGLD